MWDLVRKSINGQTAIKEAGILFLPKPNGQDQEQYNSYLKRATYAMFAARTADGLYGQIFSKSPEKLGDLPERFQSLLENVDLTGNSIDQFASDLIWDCLATGWGGILCDHAPVPDGMNQAEKEKAGLTSFMRWYSAENVINWRYDVVNNKMVLAMVVLQENYHVINDDKFNPKAKTRYRVLELTNGIYIQEVYELIENPQTKKLEHLVTEHYEPKLDGEYLDYIPFYPCPSREPEKSILLPIAYLNIGHYQLTADYINLLHYTGTPTPYAAGVEPPMEDIEGKMVPADVKLGGTSILFLRGNGEPNPRIAYLEPSGTGAGQLLASLENIKKDIEVMGADIVKEKKKGVETAEAARIHQAGENAVLGSFSLNMSERITQAVRLAARWRGIPQEITDQFTYSLNTDYESDLSDIDNINMGIRQVDTGTMSKYRFLTEIEGMAEDDAKTEMERLRGPETPSNMPVV